MFLEEPLEAMPGLFDDLMRLQLVLQASRQEKGP